jgi:hypothetical protein
MARRLQYIRRPRQSRRQKQEGREMKKEFIECKSRSTAKRRAPWACKIVKVEGGFMAFESWEDFEVWHNQK